MRKIAKRLTAVFLILTVTFSFFSGFGTVYAAPFDVSSKSAVLMDGETGEVLYNKDMHTKRPMASTTKIMTGLLVFEQENIDEYFTIDKNAIHIEGTSLGLKEGDQASLRVLAWGMLMRSGNDAANCIAVKLAGSQEKFAEMMNKRAKELGMKNTNFITPSGLPNDNHYSTAYDMAVLTKEALKNKDFAECVASAKATLEFGNPVQKRHFSNSNKLLRTYEGAIGVKTGFTKKAGRCLVSAAKRDGLTLICVTLKASDDWNVHKKLLNYGFKEAQTKELKKDDINLETEVLGGQSEKVKIGLQQDYKFAYSSKEKLEEQTVIFKNLYAPVTQNQVVGYVRYKTGGTVVEEIPLVAKENISRKEETPKKSFFQKVKDFFENLFS